MAFHDVRLPEDVERGAIGGPGFKTTVVTLSSGYEKRNIDWERTRGIWDLGYGLDNKSTQETVLAFFYARQGKANSFRFKDWTDYEIGDVINDIPQEIAVTDGILSDYQIYRTYTSGSQVFFRPITRPVNGTIQVFLAGVLQVSGFTIDHDTGVVTFTSVPTTSQTVGIIGEFDLPARFDTDQLNLRAQLSDLYSIPDVPLVELKERLSVLS